MPPPWKERLARVRQSVDAQLGESLRFMPLSGSQYSKPAADPARPAFDVIGVLQVGEGDDTNLDGGMKASWRARIPVGKAEAHLDPDVYPDILGAKQGDRIEALDRGGSMFEISRIDPPRRSRITLRLNAL